MPNWSFGSSNVLIVGKGRVDTLLTHFSISKFILLHLRSYCDTFDLPYFYSKLTIKTPERRQVVFLLLTLNIFHTLFLFLLLTLNR